MNPSARFERVNETELYQIARRAGLVVLPSTPRHKLIAYILGEEVPPPTDQVFDEWRLAIMQFVLQYRSMLETQLKCPAKSMDPRACFGCVDQQVVSCLVRAPDLDLIRLHKKPIPYPPQEETNMAQNLTPETAPRDKNTLLKEGVFQLRLLAEKLGVFEDPALTESWHQLTKEKRVDELLRLLQAHDGKGGAKPAADAVSTATVPAVNPEALAAAQAAASTAPAATPKRTPPAAKANGASNTNGQGSPDLSDVTAKLSELQTAVAGIKASVEVSQQPLAASVAALQATVAAQQDVILQLLVINLMIAEQTLGAGRSELIDAAVADMPGLASSLRSAGKAA
jgi:hypothetical protein